jgi:hypothetical protein
VSNPPLTILVPQIRIQRLKIDLFTESVSTNGTAPCRPGQSAPSQSSQTPFQIQIQIPILLQIL